MALLVFRKEEIEVLSLISGKKINSFSVLNGMENFNKESFVNKKESHLTIISDFIKDGAIWKTDDGKPHLIRELQGVFNIINSPKKTIKLKTASKQPIGEHYYCTLGDLGVLFSVGKNEEFYTIAYPFNEDLLSTWFEDEIIGDLEVADKTEVSIESTLSSSEFNILFVLIMNGSYKKSLGYDHLDADRLLNDDFLEFLSTKNIFKVNIDTVRKIIESNALESILISLEEKNLLKTDEDRIILNKILANAFEFNSLRDIVEITEITPFMRGKNLYITNHGYLSIEPVLSIPVQWKISINGLNIDTMDLMSKLIEFSDITPSDEMRTEIVNHVKKV